MLVNQKVSLMLFLLHWIFFLTQIKTLGISSLTLPPTSYIILDRSRILSGSLWFTEGKTSFPISDVSFCVPRNPFPNQSWALFIPLTQSSQRRSDLIWWVSLKGENGHPWLNAFLSLWEQASTQKACALTCSPCCKFCKGSSPQGGL